MADLHDYLPQWLLLLGSLVVVAIFVKSLLRKLRLPGVVSYLLVGFGVGVLADQTELLAGGGRSILDFLGNIGLVALLFRVGLESNVAGLLKELKHAVPLWVADVAVSGTLAFATAYYLLDFALVTSLFVGVSLAATSVGVSVLVWQETGTLDTGPGRLFVDVAELDDISSIILMGLLFAAAPLMAQGQGQELVGALTWTMAAFVGKFLAFGAACVLFALYAERHVTGLFQRLEISPDPMVSVVGIGIIIAALAGMLGVSLAIGAFFAGLTFSRDPQTLRMKDSFGALYEFFTPFFFINIGASVDLAHLGGGLTTGAALLAAAVIGKLLAVGAGSLVYLDSESALAVGLSMLPRAEIALIVVQEGQRMGAWAVPPHIFAAIVIVSAVTCMLTPIFLRLRLSKLALPGEP